MDYTTKFLKLENVTLEYQLSGEENSEAILFVHGLGANLSQFEFQQKYFSPKYKVLSINLRGHGNSIILDEPARSDFELSKMADDIIGLLDSLRISNVHYVGNSMGGNVGYEILKSKPEILKSFATYGTTGQLSTSKFLLKVMSLMYNITSTTTIGNLSKAAGQTKESKHKIKKIMSEVNKSTLLNIAPKLANFDYLDIIESSGTPSLIIKGEMDRSINKTLKNTIVAFEKRGDFKLFEMKETGHFANLDNPELFNDVLEEYILNNK